MKYIYKKVPMTNTVPLIDQLMEQGNYGWEFSFQAQEIEQSRILGQQAKMTIVNIYKKAVTDQEYLDYLKDNPINKSSMKKLN